MSFGHNLQYLRKLQGNMTQENLAEKMNVSRQTVSKWEADEAYPEMDKLFLLCDLFSCKLDALLREDLTCRSAIYSPVRIERVPGFRMARYVMITSNPEDDVNAYMDAWAQRSGLTAVPESAPRKIGWDFPFVSPEQTSRFKLRGYTAAYVLPDGFETDCPGVEYASQPDADYATITVTDPFAAAFERIPDGYKQILNYLQAGGFKENGHEGFLPCFEWVHEVDDVTCMTIYIHVESVSKACVHTVP